MGFLTWPFRQKKRYKAPRLEKKEGKLSLFADYMIFYAENQKESIKKKNDTADK